MKLFIWNCVETSANYGQGDAVIMAENIEQARLLFRMELETWLTKNREWQWIHGDEEDKQELIDLMERDVAKEPRVLEEAGGVVIRGSE